MSLNRQVLAEKYAIGKGLEIGPGRSPWPGINPDKMDIEPMPGVQFVEDGVFCRNILPDTYDYVCNSHVWEHCDDALEALENWVRIIKPGGYVIMAVPEKTQTFDLPRELTTWEHLLDEYYSARSVNRNHIHHIIDFVFKASSNPDKEAEMYLYTGRQNANIHYHVWDQKTMKDHLLKAQELFHNFDIIEFEMVGIEVFIVLRKRA